MQHIVLTIGDDGFALVTLNHATESVNLVSNDWMAELDEVVEFVANTASIKGAIIASGKSTFMAGADLKGLVAAYGTVTTRQAFELSQRANAMHRRLETCGKPFVAAINGLALGGGFELCLACHKRILADDPAALVGLPEVTVGLLPGSGGTQRLPRMIGVAQSLPLLLDGSRLKPAEAFNLGLVDQLVPRENLIESARALLRAGVDPIRPWDKKGFSLPESVGLISHQAAAMYSLKAAAIDAQHGSNYPAPIAILSAVFEGVQLPFDRALVVEARYFAKLLTSPVARNIIRTSFINKGAAEKLERRPAGVARRTVTRIGVLGAGMMGAGIAYAAALRGIDVVLLDTSRESADRGKAHAAKLFQKSVERGQRTSAWADTAISRIRPTDAFADLTGCTLIVEAVFENLEVKAAVTAAAELAAGPDLVFASNTSTLPISELAKASRNPERFIGLHFFSPVDRMELVEVITGRKTSKETLAHALDFVAQLRKTPIVVNDSRGFYTSRVFQTYIHEGAAMLGEGVLPALIENSALEAGFAIGPLALLDEVTIDLPLAIVDQALGQHEEGYTAPIGTPVLRRMKNEFKRGGRKSRGGFYEYPSGSAKHLWNGLNSAFPRSPTQPGIADVKKRLLYVQAIESARCLEENVVTHAADADLGSVLGWSFPRWTGGTLSLIDTVGTAAFVADCQRMADNFGPRFRPSDWLTARADRNQPFHVPAN